MIEVEVVREITKANLADIYKDAAQPAVRVLGKSLAQCSSLFATPIGRMAEIFEQNIHKYLDKLEGLEDNQIIAPETRILVPILERLRYTDDEVVADYYAQILATASTIEDAKKVSVAFIEILNRLCADEIGVLEFINSQDNTIILENNVGEKYNAIFSGVLPVINVHINQKGGGYSVIIKNLNYLTEKITLNNPDNLNMYFDNMFALGLLLKPAMIKTNDGNVYKYIKKNTLVEEVKSKLIEGQTISYSEARIETTELGKQLLNIASKNEK